MTDLPVLNIRDALALSNILETAIKGSKVAHIDEDGRVTYGIARSIVSSPDMTGCLSSKTDVREGYLRVTTSKGLEVTFPILDLITKYHKHTFTQYDWVRESPDQV